MKYEIDLKDYWKRLNYSGSEYLPRGGTTAAVDPGKQVVYLWGRTATKPERQPLWVFDLNKETFRSLGFPDVEERCNHKMYALKDGRLCIVGGSPTNSVMDSGSFCDEILLLNPVTLETEALSLPKGFLARGQFSAALNRDKNLLYLFGGFGGEERFASRFHRINLNTADVEELKPDGQPVPGRAGSVMEMLPDGRIFLFSGFTSNGDRAECFNDYLIYDPESNYLFLSPLNEVLGRSFAKSVVLPEKEIVLIYGGSPNGFEHFGTFLAYWYKQNVLYPLPLQGHPAIPLEPAVFNNPEKDRIVISGGLLMDSPDGYSELEDVLVLEGSVLDTFLN